MLKNLTKITDLNIRHLLHLKVYPPYKGCQIYNNNMQIPHLPKPFIIPIFLPNIGCPHRCIFCDQSAITGAKKKIPSPEDIGRYITEFLSYTKKDKKEIQLSFYGGNFLGLKKQHITRLLDYALFFKKQGIIDTIRFSTRPDTINENILSLLQPYPVSTIEIGAQSMNDEILGKASRGHKAQDTIRAVNLLKKTKYQIGLQLMVGLPEDNQEKAMQTFRRAAELNPDFIRIYPTVVLKDSILEKLYQSGEYKPMSLETTVSLVKKIYIFLMLKQIPVIRMGLQADNSLTKKNAITAGPFHPSFGHLVHSEIFFDKAALIIKNLKGGSPKAICIKVHPVSISKMQGLKNKNIYNLKKQFDLKTIKIIQDPDIDESQIEILKNAD